MSEEEYGMTSKGLNFLEQVFGLDFLTELNEKYPNVDTDDDQNRKFWDEIAQKRGFKNHKEWMDSEEPLKCECDCCTKCILCMDAPRTKEDPWCKECRDDMNTRFDKLEANKNE